MLRDDPRLPLHFWTKVAPEDEDGCWLWTASDNGKGYGKYRHNRRQSYAHRVAYQELVGPIPEGLVLDHLCRKRRCVNPAHLEPVTHGVNLRRGETITARNASRTHCPSGHEYDELNTYIFQRKDGRGANRLCKICQFARHHKIEPSSLTYAPKRPAWSEEAA